MGNDGKQHYTTAYYNLDAILSVGYRVNSVNATAFRRWSNTILKQYLLQGYSINRHLVAHAFSRLQMDKGIIMRSVINLSSIPKPLREERAKMEMSDALMIGRTQQRSYQLYFIYATKIKNN